MASDLDRGIVLGERFEIERLVARGGMGTVYRALDRADDAPVALKLLSVSLESSGDAERFAREVEILTRLRHPRVVKYVGHGETPDGRPYLVMQWLEGEDMKTALERRRLSLNEVRSAIEGAAEALAEVHALGVIHRDLKPGNLFLRGGSTADVVLLDFGIARRAEATRRLTATGTLVGTPHYMAPEQAGCGSAIVPATDIFSLGCIFYECLTGKTPFDAPHIAGVLARILFEAPEPVHHLRPSVPTAWSGLLDRMLSKDPARRPKDAGALRGELARLPPISESATSDTVTGLAAPPLPDKGSEQMLVCVVLVSFARSSSPTPEEGQQADEASLAAEVERAAEARSALHRFGFVVEVMADSSVIATLASSGAATDQARIAARSALYLRERWPSARIAVATGRALLRQTMRIGEAVDRAARLLEQTGARGRAVTELTGVWLDSVTAGLLDARFITVSHDSSVILRGERPDADESRLLLGKPTPCVGRELELAQLEGLISRVIDDGTAQAVLVLAPPGVGKSRLRHELQRRVHEKYPEAEVLLGHGDPLTAGSPYGLLSDALKRHAGLHVSDDPARARAAVEERLCRHVDAKNKRRVAELLGELCGIPFPAEESPPLVAARSDPQVMSEQITHAFLDWIAAECAAHPVVLILEDLQWGDGLTVKLVESALRTREDAPLFVLALGRPEVKATFPGLLAERAQEIPLRPLSRKASERLIKGVLGDAAGPDTLARIVELAAGNALFLEELIRAAAEGNARDVPETVLAMLQARLARLAPEARRALRAASILGEVFWLSGVRRLCEHWGASEDVAPWIEQLVDGELIERRRQSRLPERTEYNFRHGLVRDAAYGLLTDEDRRAGHHVAGMWLEAMGEADAIALAGHAEEGGDMDRAIAFYAAAAEQSFGQNDFAEALARARKGAACGAAGEALGTLRSIQAVAHYNLGDWPRACEVGLAALDLLPRGGVWWCRAVEKLLHALPQTHQAKRADDLFHEMLETQPAERARPAYVSALASLIGGCALAGARDRVDKCVDMATRAGAPIFAHDPYARGVMSFWHAWAIHLLERDPYRVLSLLEQSVSALEEGQVAHYLCMARAYKGSIELELGDGAGARESTRCALAAAERLGDSFALVFAKLYRALVLGESEDPAELDEAERCAELLLDPSRNFQASGHWALAKIAISRGAWARAEAEARRARERYTYSICYSAQVESHIIRALYAQGRAEEAAALARESVSAARAAGCVGLGEVPLYVAAAEALFVAPAGAREEAEATLRDALRLIELRASKIPDEVAKHRYLTRNKDVSRARELERAWLA